jgi:hypothetical protein
MRKIFLSGVLVVLAISLFAQTSATVRTGEPVKLKIRKKVDRPEGKSWYINVSAGYGIPFLSTNKRSPLKEIGDKDWFQHGNQLSVKPLFGTNGGGFAVNFGWGHMFNKYIGIDILHTFAWHPEKLDSRIDLSTYYATQKTGTFSIYISPHLVMRWDNGKRFGITGRAGVVAPLFGKTSTRPYIKDQQGRIIETLAGLPILPLNIPGLLGLEIEIVGRAHTEFKPTIGASASIGFDVKLNKRLTFFTELRVQAYTINLRETIFDEFRQTSKINVLGIKLPAPEGLLAVPSNVENISKAPEFLKHYVYRNEITAESNTARYGQKSLFTTDGIGGLVRSLTNQVGIPTVDINKPMDEPGQKFNASTLYFNAGLRLNFENVRAKTRPSENGTSSKPKKSKKSKSSKYQLNDPDNGAEIK